MYISAMLSPDMREVYVWERDGASRQLKAYNAPWYFYVEDPDGKYLDIFNRTLTKLEFDDFSKFKEVRDRYRYSGERIYESDIGPEYKILSEKYYNSISPKLNITFFDIEVDYDPNIGHSTPENPYACISSISIYHAYTDKMIVLAVPPKSWKNSDKLNDELTDSALIFLFKNEKQLLEEFLQQIQNSDILCGWNSDFYDIPYIYERLCRVFGKKTAAKLCFDNARAPKYKKVKSKFGSENNVLELYGRISVDYMELFKKFEQENRESYKLESIADEELPDLPKLDFGTSLHKLYNDDFNGFIRYNIRDSEILKGLEAKFQYVQLAIDMSHASTGMVQNIMGTIKLAELAVINYCHYDCNRIVPDSVKQDMSENDEKYGGALVLPPQIGMHEYTSAVDVISLYPSTMISLNISPEMVIGQFFENDNAFDAIYSSSTTQITLQFENGEILSKPANEWESWLRENQYILSGYGTIFDQSSPGVIPSILKTWFADRIKYKKLYSETKKMIETQTDKNIINDLKDKAGYYYRIQYIKKIQLNSMYGALGNKFFKFYDVRLAESTTKSGREILMHMVRTVAENIDGTYTYPSESTIYSDTDSCYFKTHATTTKEAIQIAKAVENKVNNSFPRFMSTAFLCNSNNNNYIKAELDIISKNSIFVKKKMYIMDLIYKEGKEISEVKIMGLQLKKTTIPKHIRKKLTSFILNVLRNVNWRETSEQIVEYKEYLNNTVKILDVGLPKAVKKVEEYTENYNLNSQTRLPGHVAASIFWNICLDEYNDKETQKITTGTKIKVYYLTKSFGRFKSIAVPTDLVELPKWFIDNFLQLIDRPKQTERLVDKTLEPILNAISYEIPTRKMLLYYDIMSD